VLSERVRAELLAVRPFLARYADGSLILERAIRARSVLYLAQKPMELMIVSRQQEQLLAALGWRKLPPDRSIDPSIPESTTGSAYRRINKLVPAACSPQATLLPPPLANFRETASAGGFAFVR